jgi:hypothetical protein
MQAENSIINQLEIHKCPNQLFDRYSSLASALSGIALRAESAVKSSCPHTLIIQERGLNNLNFWSGGVVPLW